VDERLSERQAILSDAVVQFGLIARAKLLLARSQPVDLELVEIARLHADLQNLEVEHSRLFSQGGKRGRRDRLQLLIDDYTAKNPTAKWKDLHHYLRRRAEAHDPVIDEVTTDWIFWGGRRKISIKSLPNRLTRARALLRVKATRSVN
jgi:hypothetical protein